MLIHPPPTPPLQQDTVCRQLHINCLICYRNAHLKNTNNTTFKDCRKSKYSPPPTSLAPRFDFVKENI